MRQNALDAIRVATEDVRNSNDVLNIFSWQGLHKTQALHSDVELTDCKENLSIVFIEDLVMYVELSCEACGVNDIMINYEDLGLDSLQMKQPK